MRRVWRWLQWLFWIGILLATALGIGSGVFLYDLSKELPTNIDTELEKRDTRPTVIYDRNGNQIDELYIQRRIIVTFEEFPPHLVQALLASEDSRFFSHYGIDPIRIFKALYIDIMAGGFVQGASTLTQQTARLFLLSTQKLIIRKLRELLLAFQLERQFTKEQILSLYLNKVFLGNAEGVEAAAQGYFGKHVRDLTVAESALLVGVLPAPSRYNPNVNPELALQRRNVVLQRMLEERYLTPGEYRVALQEPLKLIRIDDPTADATAYYVEHARRYLLSKYGKDSLYQGGLRVKLAMDLDYQIFAHEALQRGVLDLTRRQGYRGALFRLEPAPDNATTTLDNATAAELVTATSDNNSEALAAYEVLQQNRMLLGNIVYGIVTSLDEEEAVVWLGGQEGVLDWESIRRWQLAGKQQGDPPEPLKQLSDALAQGDLVRVRLADFHSEADRFQLELYQPPRINGAVMVMNPGDGQVLAMIGGYRHETSEFNRAIQAKRQPGSAFKPIVYAAALDAGYTPASQLIDSPRAYRTGESSYGSAEIWIPKNYSKKLLGNVSLRTALVKSLNLPTIGLVDDLDPRTIISYAQRLGITTTIPSNLTIALGSFSVTLQEMVSAYAVYANQGKLRRPVYLLRVEDQHGNVLEQWEPQAEQVISPETAFLVGDILRDVVRRGTGWRARSIERPSAGKTGTTNDYIDAWYIGYIPQLITGVYVGFDQPRSLGPHESGSRAAAPIWVEFMKNAVASLPTEQFPQPPGVITVRIHSSGRRAGPCDSSDQTQEEHFRMGTEPPVDPLVTLKCGSAADASGAERAIEDEEALEL
jgi:penicillin-binding protein 1A